VSYCDLYKSRAKDLRFTHVVNKTSPHNDIQLSKIRSFVAVQDKIQSISLRDNSAVQNKNITQIAYFIHKVLKTELSYVQYIFQHVCHIKDSAIIKNRAAARPLDGTSS